jgi:hypothetical protein
MTDLNDIDTIYKPHNNTCFSANISFYKNNIFDEVSFNNYIEDNYYNYTLPINNDTVNDCRKKAIENNKDYFLLSDISSNQEPNSDNVYKFKTNCLIPKYDSKCNMSNLDQFLAPINDKVKELINENSPISNIYEISVTSFNNLNVEINDSIYGDNNCFKITDISNLFLAKDNNLVLYKIDTILNENDIVGKLRQVKSYKHYREQLDIYFDKTNFEADLDSLYDSFERYICNPVQRSFSRQFDEKMFNLKDKYNIMFSTLDSISRDISTIHFLTKNDTIILKDIQEKINNKKIQLRNILGLDGAGNGKLNDTNFMKNLKFSETLILFLIIVSLIFIYSKKK